jgi:hypothetical protein
LANHDLGRYKALASPARARSWHSKCSPGAQAGRQFATQPTSALNEQGLVDGFMADTHGHVIREVNR